MKNQSLSCRSLFPLITFCILLNVPATSHAAFVQGVTIKAFSSEFTSAGRDHRRVTNLVSNIGLFGDVHTTDPIQNMWLSFSATAGNFTNEFVTFDLGSAHTVNRMKVWNYNESGVNSQRGIQKADISVAGEDLIFTTNFPNVTFTRAPGLFTNFFQLIDFGGVSARYVRINVLTNFLATEPRVGLSKVRFIDDSVPPTVTLATRSYSGNQVTVQFSESVSASTATNATNYSITSGTNTVTILSAATNVYNDSILLQTSTLDSNLVYTLSVQNVRDIDNVISVASTPVTIAPELMVWLKADVGVTADGSGFVSQWNDQSGNGNNAVQTTNGVQPTLVTGAVNGNPVVHFDGTSQLMEIARTASLTADRDFTLYLVLSADTLVSTATVNGQSPISVCPTNVPGSFDLQIVRTTGKLSFLRGNGMGFSSFSGSAAIAINQYYLVSIVMKGTNASSYLNGNFNGTASLTTGIFSTGYPIRLGVRQDLATRFQGNLAEVMLLRGAVSGAEKIAIDNYLGAKYGISVIALAITEQPQNATAQVGKTATFWVNAIAGSPTINYQWQSNSVNIVGATNSVYTTPALTLAANGAAYRAIVSTPLGITNASSAATLTVIADTQSPALSSGTRKAGSTTDIVVTYSEAVAPATATNVSNYSLNNGVTISSAVMGSSSNQVVLTTSGLNATTSYLLTVQNVQDLFTNTIVQTTALLFPSNMSLWLRADSGVIADGSGLVSQWFDQSSNTNNASQFAGPLLRPTLLASSINSKPALTFNGLSNYLQAASSPTLAIPNDISLYVVTRIAPLAANGYAHFIGKTLANQPASYDYYVHNGANGTLYRGNGTVSARVLETAIPSFGVPHVMNVVMSGTSVSHFLDGAANGTGILATNMADAGRPLRIGSRDALDVYMNGEIAEVMIFNSAISTSDRKAIDSYLGFKYFPLTITQPTNITRLEGQIATFTVLASAGPAAFSYQWQRGTVDIPGATNASYTTPILTQADSGSTYRVIITPLNSSPVISDSATLTVSPDSELPTVISVGKRVWSTNQIVVVFSEAVSPSTATNLSNYALDNGATITSATIGDTPNQVILTVSGLNPATTYSLTVQNVKDLFNNTMVQTTVISGVYPPSLALWLKADTGVTADAQNLVSAWADQSGNNNTASAFGDSAPLFVASAPGGQPALNFNGTNQYLVVNNSPGVALTGDLTIYVAAQIKDFISQTNEISLLGKSGGTIGNQPASYDFYLLKNSGLPRFFRGDGTSSSFLTGSNAPSLGTTHLLTVKMSGQNAVQYLDSQINAVGTLTAPIGDTGNPLGIGTRFDLRPKMNGNMQEILLFASALSDADRTALDSYLAAKYGVLLGPTPVISISRSGNNVVLSWPTPNVNFVLETTSALGASWTTATNTVTSVNGTNSATINAATGNGFYRLHQQ